MSDFLTNPSLEVEKFILHEGYKKGVTAFNDIAVIKLKNPVKFTNGLNPICLPDFDETDNMFAYGLGKQNQNGQKVAANVMHEVELDRISTEKCKEYYSSDYNFNVNYEWNFDYTMCSLNDKINTAICMGDSGGPVSTRKSGQVYQVGLPSMAPGNCNIHNEIFPDAYEKVFAHLDWIRKQTEDGEFCEGIQHPFAKSQ